MLDKVFKGGIIKNFIDILARSSIETKRLSRDREICLSFLRVVPEEVVLFLVLVYKPEAILPLKPGFGCVLGEDLLDVASDDVFFARIGWFEVKTNTLFKLSARPFNSTY